MTRGDEQADDMVSASESDGGSLKLSVARTLKWNVIDRFSSQVLYTVTGVVLARMLTQEEFGLVGAILVFQAFAALFVDSGFASALLQRKAPSRLDYSTVLWFNFSMAVVIYILLFFLAPWISDIFQGDERIIPLSRVMFLTFIVNSLTIVQVNRLIKRMDTRMVAISNSLGLVAGAVVGIFLAVSGYGAWALVWQAMAISVVKAAVLWATSGWRPLWKFSYSSLRSFFTLGTGVMFSSLLNTIFQTIGSFFIGSWVNLGTLGYYTQADKWSKMGVTSLTQVFTSSFVPLLSGVQDDPERYAHMCGKTHRLASYLLFPAMCLLAVMARPIFHTLFGEKWDASIILFQLLLLRGIFMVLSGLYSNFILSVAKSKMLVACEVIRDGASVVAVVLTLPYIALTTPDNIVYGVEIFLWGQLAATFITWCASVVFAVRISHRSFMSYIGDIAPYFTLTCLALVPGVLLLRWDIAPLLTCILQATSFLLIYMGINAMLKSRIQSDVLSYLFKRMRK
ncbi:MAG: lipopolysaccharide biosynthesis protein [Paenibacillus sp.]|nr:lipopolysaccharide biosynthesis protein [Paenibacillus sp.]